MTDTRQRIGRYVAFSTRGYGLGWTWHVVWGQYSGYTSIYTNCGKFFGPADALPTCDEVTPPDRVCAKCRSRKAAP